MAARGGCMCGVTGVLTAGDAVMHTVLRLRAGLYRMRVGYLHSRGSLHGKTLAGS